MTFASPTSKMGLEEGQGTEQKKKSLEKTWHPHPHQRVAGRISKSSARKKKTPTEYQDTDLHVKVDELNKHTMVEMIWKSLEASERQIEQSAKLLKAIEDSTHMMGKLVYAVTKMSRSMDEHYREQRKRED